MKKFRFEGDIEFYAENAEEAAKLIASHFTKVARAFSDEDGEEDVFDTEPWYVGNLKFAPVKDVK